MGAVQGNASWSLSTGCISIALNGDPLQWGPVTHSVDYVRFTPIATPGGVQ